MASLPRSRTAPVGCSRRRQSRNRTLASLAFAGDSIITDTTSICQALARRADAVVAPAQVTA